MATLSRTPIHGAAASESFFSKPVSRLLSVFLLFTTGLCLYLVVEGGTNLEELLKFSLLTIPASLYLAYRSFVLKS